MVVKGCNGCTYKVLNFVLQTNGGTESAISMTTQKEEVKVRSEKPFIRALFIINQAHDLP